jgi:hypothetical protein
MRDNFDLQGYLRKNNKLLNEAFEGFGGYRDLTPLKEDNEESGYYEEAKGEGMFYVDLDSANFDDKLFQADLRANKIKTKIIDPEGPAGYAPVVRYMASKQTLADMITKHWATDPEEAAEWFDEIQPMNEGEDLGGWDGDGQHDQYDGEYDDETGPAIVDETEGIKEAKKPAFVIPVPGSYDIEDDAKYIQSLLNKVGVKAKVAPDMYSEELRVYTNDEKMARKVIQKSGYQIGWSDDNLEELQKPEKIYADDEKKSYFVTDDSDDEKGWGNDSADIERMYELFELQLQKLISDIVDDGYEHSDAAQFLRDYADHIDKGGM